MKELIALLNEIKPQYGAVGSRDVDVTAQRKRIDDAIAMLYEQAAKNPVAWVATDSEGFPEYSGHNEFSSSCGVGTPLYAAPVLPKQPELVENLKKVMNNWLAMEPKLAFQPEFTDVMMLIDAEPAPSQPAIPEQNDLSEKLIGLANHISSAANGIPFGWQDWADEIVTDLRSLASTAQPVSEHKPYAWAIEHKVGLPTVVFNKPNTNSWAFKDAVIKELYEAPEQESE